jgi:hypothetical protein
MVEVETKIYSECMYCDEKIDLIENDSYICCPECDLTYAMTQMKDFMEAIIRDKEWENIDGYSGFKSEEQKEWYMKGIRKGIDHALFSYASNYGSHGEHVFDALCHLFGYKNIKESKL